MATEESSPSSSPVMSTAPSAGTTVTPTQPGASVTPNAPQTAPAVTMSAMMTPVTAAELSSQVSALPAGVKTASAYVEKAQRGDSLTKLSRRATTRWLSENSSGYAITNEHRVYIEDYIRKHVQKHPVTVGQDETISVDLVSQAVASAGQLNNNQLHNLSKYVGHVRF